MPSATAYTSPSRLLKTAMNSRRRIHPRARIQYHAHFLIPRLLEDDTHGNKSRTFAESFLDYFVVPKFISWSQTDMSAVTRVS